MFERVEKLIRLKLLKWLLKDGLPELKVGGNTIKIDGESIILPALTADPTLAAGKIWFRDTGKIRWSPDGSTVKEVSDITAADVWSYSERTLTQTKFPFWSAIIEQTQGEVSVAAASTSYVNIQPPSGETWLLFIDATDAGSDTSTAYCDYDGSTRRIHTFMGSGGTCGRGSLVKILTNSLYASLRLQNFSTASKTFYYGYSGFKLSKPIWKPRRLNTNDPPWKRVPSQYPIPKEVEPLKKYIVDVYDHDLRKYRQAIICEEDTPLAVNEKGFPVERLTVICFVNDFIERILKPYKEGTLDLKASGWKKYFDKWAEEGISLQKLLGGGLCVV
ncbi:hypothetical protein DRO69_02810 [Candidatus Bathyarchaeota archaeon]|nr:MAG: hypothetical protein DRO69_02810 [Candidatus Bathyarchaeota archaeon]